MKLRQYQVRAVTEMRAAFAAHRAVLLALQVGGGKTIVACEMIRLALERGRRALFVAHRAELVTQARDRLAQFGIKAGIIKAGYTERRELPVQVACVPTLVRREFPPADLLIFDEAHRSVGAMYLRVAKHYLDAGAWLAGITATPLRLDGRGLGEVFDVIVEPVTTRELIEQGFLIEPTVFAPPSCDLKGVKVRGGDYALPELATRMNKLTGSITETWFRLGRGQRTVVFAVNIDHSKRIAEAFAATGARVIHIDGKSSRELRERANRDLRAGVVDVVTQCQLWTEGVDIPELECLVIARPTQSCSLHRQMIGRVLRPAPNKTGALVLDHAGNHHRHGAVTDDIAWSLDAKTRRTVATESLRTCAECYAVIPPAVSICPQCGAPVSVREEADPPSIDNPGELTEYRSPHRKASIREKQAEYRLLVRTASMQRYRIGWARMKYKDEFGTWPRLRMIEDAEYRCEDHKWETKTFGSRTVRRCVRCCREAGRVGT